MHPRHTLPPEEVNDTIRAMLYLYTLSKGLPPEGQFAGETPLQTQINVLAVLAGWPRERAVAALDSVVKHGFGDRADKRDEPREN